VSTEVGAIHWCLLVKRSADRLNTLVNFEREILGYLVSFGRAATRKPLVANENLNANIKARHSPGFFVGHCVGSSPPKCPHQVCMILKSLLYFLLASSVCTVAFAQTPTVQRAPAVKPAPQVSAQGAAEVAAPQTPPDDSEFVETPISADAVDLGTIIVGGRQPGPGLWKVRKGDHVLWILGTQSPLPKRMEWDSANVQRRIVESQQVLLSPSVTVKSDMGFLRSLTLIPSALKARKNPDEKTLQDIVPPAQYARWLVLKKRYIGGDRGVEEWRPVFAALELYSKAIAKSGMTLDSLADDVVRKTAKKNDIPMSSPKVEIKIEEPKAALKAFARQPLEDMDCFARTLDRIESDLGTMAARANAWAEGDTESLRDLPFRNQFVACSNALTGNEIAKKLGISDVQQRVETAWMTAAEDALAKNASSFAILPVGQLLREDGFLAKLAAKGYMIEEP
jgi:TraB/PrgY/gumN family